MVKTGLVSVFEIEVGPIDVALVLSVTAAVADMSEAHLRAFTAPCGTV